MRCPERISVGGWVLSTALIVMACDTSARDAYDRFRATAPLVCKDYCEERIACEWEGVVSTFEPDAFSAAVRQCVSRCTAASVEGGYVYHAVTVDQPGDGASYDDVLSGGELIELFECLYNAGAYRCVDSGNGGSLDLRPPVLSVCDYAAQCVSGAGVSMSLSWTADPSGVGGTCVRGGTQFIDAFFFDGR